MIECSCQFRAGSGVFSRLASRCIFLIAGMWIYPTCVCAPALAARLSRTVDTFFVEDDQAYTRCLWLEAAGTYRQVVNGFGLAREVDQGTWEQAAGGEVVLRPTNGALTFRAVSAGPLWLAFDRQAQVDSVPELLRAITGLLERFQDQVFARDVLAELESLTGGRITLPADAATFERTDLLELSRRLATWLQDRTSGAVVFDLLSEQPAPALLIQRGAVYAKDSLASVRRDYKVARTAAPPFYFARTDEKTWRLRAGRWLPFDHLGGSHPAPVPAPTSR